MKATKVQIRKVKSIYKKAKKAQLLAEGLAGDLAAAINDITELDGHVDHLSGDGFGYSPSDDDDIHISIDKAIGLLDSGEELNEESVRKNMSL